MISLDWLVDDDLETPERPLLVGIKEEEEEDCWECGLCERDCF